MALALAYRFRKTNALSIHNKQHQGCSTEDFLVVYHESLRRDLKTKPINECRCDDRLKTRVEESTRLGFPRLVTELEHRKIETRFIDEMFTSEMGEYVFLM
jgi:hypothetical protein